MNESPWRPAASGAYFSVTLLRFNGDVRDTWQASLESSSDEMIVLRAISSKRLRFETLTIEPGDQVRQYFFPKDWFYIQEYSDAKGHLKGWYCNIGTPATLKDGSLTTRDLILDIFVRVDRSYEILDESELEEKRQLVPAPTLRKIQEAREKLVQMIEKREPPFDHRNENL